MSVFPPFARDFLLDSLDIEILSRRGLLSKKKKKKKKKRICFYRSKFYRLKQIPFKKGGKYENETVASPNRAPMHR